MSVTPLLTVIQDQAAAGQVGALLRQIGAGKIIETDAVDEALLRLRYADPVFSAVICGRLAGEGHLDILKFIRGEQTAFDRTLPVVCVAGDWTIEEKAGLESAGATRVLALPTSGEILAEALAWPARLANGPVLPPRGEPDFIWSKAIQTGRQDIDDDHRKIFDLLDLLKTKCETPDEVAQTIQTVLAELKDYVAVHFSNEEKIMDSFDYDQKAEHKKLHKNFKKKIESLTVSNFKTDTLRKRLLIIIYDWLMTHIISIDRVMIAKLTGEYNKLDDDCFSNQTQIVIADAYATVTQIKKMAINLTAAGKNRRQADLLGKIAEATERLINLMVLAESRIESVGCTAFQIRCLTDIRTAVASNAENLAEAQAHRLFHYGSGILSGRHGLPLGVGAVMALRRNRIESLVGVAGGLEALGASTKDVVVKALDIARAVIALEQKGSTELSDLQPLSEGGAK